MRTLLATNGAFVITDERGEPAKPPIALVEVQGYAYWALYLTGKLKLTHLSSETLLKKASKLKKHFNRYFWTGAHYAIAIDGTGDPLNVVSSNMGHLLVTGIADHKHDIIKRLFQSDMISHYEIRTLSSMEPMYDPFSYHNGGIWSHDNALIALGLARVGRTDLAKLIMSKVIEAAKRLPWMGLPELCGGTNILIPIQRADYPQAGSAASVFDLVRASLGMEANQGLVFNLAKGLN